MTEVLAYRQLAGVPLVGRPRIMGIVNVTPDSFYDGGRLPTVEAALLHCRALAEEGADFIDIGAESTRPGHTPISAEEELARLMPVLERFAAESSTPISVDTMKAKVAAAAVAAGARIINDIWGLQRDPDMARVAAEHGVPVIAMHNRAEADASIDILADMRDFFARTLDIAARAGIPRDNIVLDPGIGFGKTPRQNLVVLRHLAELRQTFGLPMLVGASRKSFIGHVVRSMPDERLPGTLAAHLVAAAAGCEIVRVHDVVAHVQALSVADAIAKA
jgi:dihydropteroate synthase